MFTKYKNNHNQICQKCKIALTTLEDYVGGGSHYWVLHCHTCDQKYVFDTYRFKLEKWDKNEISKFPIPDKGK